MRRRTRSEEYMPECLRRLDWREWRPPAPPGHPCPFFVEWYAALGDWQAAREAWVAGRPVLLPPDRPLPDPIPYTGVLSAIEARSGEAPPRVPKSRPIKLR